MSAAAVAVVATSGERSRRKGRRWCYLQVKLCDPRLSALSVVATIKALYNFTSFLSFIPVHDST